MLVQVSLAPRSRGYRPTAVGSPLQCNFLAGRKSSCNPSTGRVPGSRSHGPVASAQAGAPTAVSWYYEGTDGLIAVPMAERAGAPDPGTPQKLFALHTQGYVSNQPHNVEVAANGQRFLVNAIVGDTDNVPIEVTLNWTTALKK